MFTVDTNPERLMVKNGYSVENLTAILNAFKDLAFIFDDDGVIVDYLQEDNSQWLYVPKEQFVGKHHQEVLPAHVSEKINEAIREIRKGRETYTFDYNLEIKGNVTWFTAVFSPVRKDKETPSNYLCAIREITQRKEKELLLQGVLDNAFNPFVVLRAARDNEGRVTDFEYLMVNHPAEKMIGQNFGELLKKRITEIPGQPWILFNEFIQVAETGKPLDLEYNFYKDDSKVWVHTHASKLENDIIVTVQDITEKKRADLKLQTVIDQLRLSRHHMDLFFSQALSGFFLMMMDEPLRWDDTVDKELAIDNAIENLHFTRVNSALLEQYGATEKEFISLNVKDFFKDDLHRARKLLRELYDKGSIYIHRASKRLDGSELFLEGNYIALTDDQNNILGHFGIQQDITERKWAENALRASEERYRLLANNMMDFVALHDPDGTYRYVSPSVTKILGYSAEELIGTNPYLLFHTEDIPRIQTQSHVKAVKGNEISNIEYRIRKKDGQYIWFSTSTKPITDAAGNVTMLQTVSRDVTEKIETFHILEELNHQKNKLFSVIAHDLRGPLASCMGLLNLSDRAASREDLEKYLRLARKSAVNLHELMEDLLLWAGSQLDKISFDPAIVNLKEEAEVVTTRLTEMAQAKSIVLNLLLDDDSLCVFADRDMLRTIIRNLLSNAIKFSHPNSQIDIRAKATNRLVEISVQDYGTGIKEEDIEKLFSKSSTFTTYGTGGEKGTGLGLDICKDFVEKHNGKLWVETEYGVGSKFIFTLKEF